MGFGKSKNKPETTTVETVVMEAKVFLRIPASYGQSEHEKVLKDLNSLLSNLSLEEMSVLADYISKPGAKQKALNLIKINSKFF